MNLPDHLMAKLKDQGLLVSGPWQEGARGWLGRFTLSKGRWVEQGGIRVLEGPILWIYEEQGLWFAEKREWIPGPSPTDFQCKHATAEEAVDVVLRFFACRKSKRTRRRRSGSKALLVE
jgi:hypothetical protein